MRYLIAVLVAIAVIIGVTGCNISDPACLNDIDDAIAEYGQPDDWTTYQSDNYASDSLWWWDLGLNQSFSTTGGGCKISTYRF